MTDPNRADLELHVPEEDDFPKRVGEANAYMLGWRPPAPRRRFGCAWLPLLLLALAVGG